MWILNLAKITVGIRLISNLKLGLG